MNKTRCTPALGLSAFVVLTACDQQAATNIPTRLDRLEMVRHRFDLTLSRPINRCAELPSTYTWLAGAPAVVSESDLQRVNQALDACGAPKPS